MIDFSLFETHISSLQQQVEQALSQHDFDALLIGSGHTKKHFLDDTHYAFRANPHFVRWVPFLHESADCWLLIQKGKKPALYIYAPNDFWYQSTPLPVDEWAGLFDITLVTDPAPALMTQENQRYAVVAEEPLHNFSNKFECNPDALLNTLHFDRAIKTSWEIECIFRANCCAVKGHAAAKALFQKSIVPSSESSLTERALHNRYLQATGHLDHELPYNVIMALNENAATLHYQHKSRSPLPVARTLLLDGGASYLGYAADITRTWSASAVDMPQAEQAIATVFAAIVKAVERLQLSVIEQIKPGLDYIELHRLAHQYLVDVLLSTKLLAQCPPTDEVQEVITRTFFPHGLGHFLGIQTHDVAGFQQDSQGTVKAPPASHPFLRLTRVLEEGMVLTVEPGLYFIPSLLEKLRADAAGSFVNWDLVDQLKPWGGVRIEDNILVTATGARNLTREAFAVLDAN
ncbi:Xaa-Pro dipeptidase [Neptunomonas phycophila]|uniref:Xaa-Pro dipeptidase n=1 Tax=Neptunomonas phycophila TaxID=1572645 RepID=UPI0015B847F7|nr:Xaa-Pro dipeptidase [Neptunomonas phycophila]QLE98327.1 Xaa-Pro dipeptidase [Neptunomonas phycophila]